MLILKEILNESELKTRERWLLWGIKIPAVIAALLGIFMVSSMIANPHTELGFQLFAIIGVSVSFGIFSFYLPYYCAYKKHGTIYLTLYLILTTLSLVVDYFSKALSLEGPPAGYQALLFLAGMIISSFYLYLSWRLLQINKKIQKYKLQNSEHYQNAMKAFEACLSPEQCKDEAEKLMRGVDEPSIRNEIGIAYNDYKNRF